MPAQRITIRGKRERDKIRAWLETCEDLSRVTLNEPKRSFEQNSALWPALTDISEQKTYFGRKLPPKKWKLLFMESLSDVADIVPNLDGTGTVNIGSSSSELNREDFSGLLHIVHEWGARNGVTFKDPESSTSEPAGGRSPAGGGLK